MTMTPEKTHYTAHATVTGGRAEGRARTEDGVLDLSLTAPKETGGTGEGTNPEALFAIGYGACFQGALAAVAGKQDIDASASVLEVAVGIGKHESSMALTVELTATIPGVDAATTQKLMEHTHQVCPYSKAISGNVPVTLSAKDG